MDQTRDIYEEEISLRELIEALLKRKKSIAIITIACITLAVVYSFLIVKPTYEASAMLRLGEAPISTEDYVAQINNHDVLSRTISDLELSKHEISEEKLVNIVTVSQIEETNLIEITAKGTDPNLIASIANEMAVNSKATLIPVYENSLVHINESISLLQKMIEASTEELSNASQFVILKKNLVEDEALRAFFAQSVDGNASLSISINSEEMNTRYIVLQENIFNDNISLIQRREEASRLQDKIDRIKLEIDGAAPVNTFTESFIVSEALPPTLPVSPNKTLNMAIGAVLGLMLGAFWAFFREYWENTGEQAPRETKREDAETLA